MKKARGVIADTTKGVNADICAAPHGLCRGSYCDWLIAGKPIALARSKLHLEYNYVCIMHAAVCICMPQIAYIIYEAGHHSDNYFSSNLRALKGAVIGNSYLIAALKLAVHTIGARRKEHVLKLVKAIRT